MKRGRLEVLTIVIILLLVLVGFSLFDVFNEKLSKKEISGSVVDTTLSCSDGTTINTCVNAKTGNSLDKPRYCNPDGNLIFDCFKCGCSGTQPYCKTTGLCAVRQHTNLFNVVFNSNEPNADINVKRFDIFLSSNPVYLRSYTSAPSLGYNDDIKIAESGNRYYELSQYALNNNDNIEKYFFHFSNHIDWTLLDSTSSSSPSLITRNMQEVCTDINLCPYNSRIPTEYWNPKLWAFNFNYAKARDFLMKNYQKKIEYDYGDGITFDGIFLDNSLGEYRGSPVYQLTDAEGKNAEVIEYSNSLDPAVDYYNDRILSLNEISSIMKGKLLIINKYSASYFPNQYLDYINGLFSEDYLSRTTWKGYLDTYYLPQREILKSKNKLHLIQCADNDYIGKMYCLSFFYVFFNSDYDFFGINGDEWFAALDFNFGVPIGDFKLDSSIDDPSCLGKKSFVYSRDYENALVLVRLPDEGCKSDYTSRIDFPLPYPGNFNVLNLDGTLSYSTANYPLPIMNNQGYILIKDAKCMNGGDDDSDGKIDLEDPGCMDNPYHYSEIGQCQDNLDNDGDGFVDLDDINCEQDESKNSEFSQCNDNLDNDRDEKIDLLDSGCSEPMDNDETDPNKFYIKFQEQNVAWFGDKGNIALLGTCQVESNCITPADSFIFKDSNGETVGYVNIYGNLCIETGDCLSSTSCSATSNDEFIIQDETGKVVSKIDLSNGDLCYTGKLIENDWSLIEDGS